MYYDQNQIDAEFRELACEADNRVKAIERAGPDPQLADHHDECLGHLAVYDFLRARPYLKNPAAMLAELRWLRDSELPAPGNAIDPNRFAASRYTLVRRLILRFERFAEPALA